MRQITEYGNNHAYVLANDKLAEDMANEFIDSFMGNRNNENYIFIIYHVKKEIVLIHFEKIEDEVDFNAAIQSVKENIKNGNLHADDRNLKKALRNPQATTAQILLNYIESGV